MDVANRSLCYGSNNKTGDASGVLDASSYSLRDISNDSVHQCESLSNEDDVKLLDHSTLALLNKPYSQLQDRLRLRQEDQYDGFDNSTGSSWIYPTNYPVRQYQFTITKAALFKNTLVVLPTGLGKTFIAAVVMYNIYRWYPTGKVIFMAPTRPLVSQQIEACYQIMGIPREDTVEITGRQQRKRRLALWQTKRVFYVTPQVVQADLCMPEQAFPIDQVRLIVIDEAHKAKGRYAYTEVIRMVAARNKHFRVLALSATPGRSLEDVAEVIQNLMISHIEVRWENSIDVSPYTFRKRMRTIVTPLGTTIRAIREQLIQLIEPYVRRLLDANVLSCGNPANMTRGMIIMEQKRFRENSLLRRHPNHSTVNADFAVCVSMFHALDLLVRHGIRALLNYFADGYDGTPEKYFVTKDRHIKEFLERFREQYGSGSEHIAPGAIDMLKNNVATLPATSDDDIDFGHPKFRILENELATHFAELPDSKAIVFCEFRDSVLMIHRMLSQRRPLIRPKCIVGQGGTNGTRAVTQKEQIAAMQQFRAGVCNTLIATCVAEEGIDVGEVDLIVCFDITKNPTRFVQRIGRTGRQRIGRVLMLVTEGEEHATLKKVLASKDRTNQQLAKSKDIMRILYRDSPRLVPGEFEPRCMEMYITIPSDGANSDVGENNAFAAKREPKKRGSDPKASGKRYNVTPAVVQSTVSPKATQDVRRFFQRPQPKPADIELTASEQDVFFLRNLATAHRSPAQRERPHNDFRSPQGTPVDRCIRTGRSDREMTIERRLQPLVHHYEQLRRQKFIHRQQLLAMPTVEQILKRRTLATVRWELAQELLVSDRDAPRNDVQPVVRIDDSLDLPVLRPVPEFYCRNRRPMDDAPSERSYASSDAVSVGPPPAMDASISNMFDSTFNLPDNAHCLHVAEPAGTEYTDNHEMGLADTSKSTTMMPSAGKRNSLHPARKGETPWDSSLLRASNRLVQKRQTMTTTTPSSDRRRLRLSVPKRAPLLESPLVRAFNRSVQKRSNSNGEPGRAGSTQQRMVLEYFRLHSVEDIFPDNVATESSPATSTTTANSSGVNDNRMITSNGTRRELLVKDSSHRSDGDVHADALFALLSNDEGDPFIISEQTWSATRVHGTSLRPDGDLQEERFLPLANSEIIHNEERERKEMTPLKCISPTLPRRPVVVTKQEMNSARKNFNFGSAVLVLDGSQDDLFQTICAASVEEADQLSTGGRPVLSETRHEQCENIATGSEKISPAVFGKLVTASPKKRPPLTKLNFPRLRRDMIPDSGQENTGECKNITLSSAALLLEDSEDDLFSSPDWLRTTSAAPDEKITLRNDQCISERVGIVVSDSIEKSPSIFAKMTTVSPRKRCPPTKLNFSRLRRDMIPDSGQENTRVCKNITLSSASLLLEDSEDDLFGSPDWLRTTSAAPDEKITLRNDQCISERVGIVVNDSIEKSPSIFAKMTTVSPRKRCPPTKLNFSRLRRDIIPDSGQENTRVCKNITLSSASLLLEDSEDDLFGSPDWLRTTSAAPDEKITLRNDQCISERFGIVVSDSVEKSPSIFAKMTTVSPRKRCPPTKLNFSRQSPSRIGSADQQPTSPTGHSSSFVTCGTQIMPTIADSPLLPTTQDSRRAESVGLDGSTISGHRLMRDRKRRYAEIVSDDDELDGNGLARRPQRMPVILDEQEASADDEDDADDGDFRTCTSDFSLPAPLMPAPEHGINKRAPYSAIRAFFHTQASGSGSDDGDEYEDSAWDRMASFVDADGSQSPETVDMRAVYLQSVRSPVVARCGYKMRETCYPTGLLYHPDDTEYDRVDEALEQQEALDSSFITDEVDVDSELSELDRAELVLQERRRAAKRKRKNGDDIKMKRRRKIIVLSESE